jgi:hypothetical protein
MVMIPTDILAGLSDETRNKVVSFLADVIELRVQLAASDAALIAAMSPGFNRAFAEAALEVAYYAALRRAAVLKRSKETSPPSP